MLIPPTKIGFGGGASASVERGRNVKNDFGPKGFFTVEVYDPEDEYGNRRLRHKEIVKNGVTDTGKNNALDVLFGSGAQITSWFLGQIDAAGFTGVAGTDTSASHTGWTEFSNYSEVTRPQWTPGAAAAGAVVNGTPVNFNITGSASLKGILAISENTKGGTTGILWATALYAADIPVNNGDLIKITYTVTAT